MSESAQRPEGGNEKNGNWKNRPRTPWEPNWNQWGYLRLMGVLQEVALRGLVSLSWGAELLILVYIHWLPSVCMERCWDLAIASTNKAYTDLRAHWGTELWLPTLRLFQVPSSYLYDFPEAWKGQTPTTAGSFISEAWECHHLWLVRQKEAI